MAYLFDPAHPALLGTAPAHRQAAAAAALADGWLGAARKPKGETRATVPPAAFELLEGLFFGHRELMRCGGQRVDFFRKEWGGEARIEVTAQCGARLVVSVK